MRRVHVEALLRALLQQQRGQGQESAPDGPMHKSAFPAPDTAGCPQAAAPTSMLIQMPIASPAAAWHLHRVILSCIVGRQPRACKVACGRFDSFGQ